jgi:cytochrome c peroxidase
MTTKQKEGAVLFFDKGECAGCHNGPSLANMEFHALGMADLVDCPDPVFKTTIDNVENFGRGGFTGNANQNYQFKVPQLYNLKDSPFYGHGSSFNSVLDVLIYKNKAVKENSRVPESALSPLFYPLNLSDQELEAITTFIEDALYDPNLSRYVPDELPTGNCFPNADLLSQQELGCL